MTVRRFLALQLAAFLMWNSAAARPAVLGVVVVANRVHLNSTAVTVGTTVYDGDCFSTEAGGMLLLSGDAAMLRLGEESAVIVRRRANGAPGTEAELSKGTVAFSAAHGSTIEVVTLGARIRPIADTRATSQVSVAGAKELRINAWRGSLQFSYRGEMETIAEGKSYRVILDSPGDSPKEKGPLRTAQWSKPFKVVIIGEVAAVVALGIQEFLEPESPDRP